MTYELAKRLKEAGFSRPIDGAFGIDKLLGGVPYSPTLSELIEACGKMHFELERDWFNGKDKWRALTWRDGSVPSGFGSTPEEAVAKLWLAMHQN